MRLILKIIFNFIFTLFFRWQVKGTENIPQDGGVIIAANHISNFDPLIIGVPLKRKIHFMAKEELFVNPILRYFIVNLGAFPVKRGAADRTAIRSAMSLLNEGKMLGMFPEGTRSKTGELGQAEQGLALIAAKTSATIIPTAIVGTNAVFKNGVILPKFYVRFGKPITTEKDKISREQLEKTTVAIMSDIAEMIQKIKAGH